MTTPIGFYPFCPRGHGVTTHDNGMPCAACAAEDREEPITVDVAEPAEDESTAPGVDDADDDGAGEPEGES
jgi:hypothetical protein